MSLGAFVVVASGTSIASAALEEPPDASAVTSPDEPQHVDLELPELLEPASPVYPEAAYAERREADVVLRLRIDAEGRVSDVEVVEPAGHGFDEAATKAAFALRFVPARWQGEAVATRVRHTVSFRPPPPPTHGAVAGQILLPEPNDVGVAATEVRVIDAAGQSHVVRTDAEGRFTVEHLPAGETRLRVEVPGLGSVDEAIAVEAGECLEPTLRLIAPEDATIEVVVGPRSQADELRQSAQAVQVIETEQAKRQTADLGEVLARSSGIGVRRGGGLGSGTRFSLNGLTDDQIRFFLDGVPLELAGYPFGIANVPVNLVERVEVYRGVVPIRFGADALGGAVNLVTDEDVHGAHGAFSYQTGSFGTHRLTLGIRHLHEPSGLFVRLGGFFDRADNDYPIDVEVADERGRLSPARVYRFHDAYRAAGGTVELGLVNRAWAKRFLVRAFVNDFQKELQHNIVMTVPYGEAEYGRLATGATLRYEHDWHERFFVDFVGGYTYGRTRFVDVGECVFNWYGQCVRERRQRGEIESRPRDQRLWEHGAFARVNFGWTLHPQHTLRLALAPTYATRAGDERRQLDPMARDPLTARRDLFTLVSGLEYELDLLDGQLENLLFVKDYVQVARSEEPLPGGVFRDRDNISHRFGVGNAFRYRFLYWLHAKASYEWAARMPRTDEMFGDGVLVVANLDLKPETSHNVNLGLTVDSRETRAGAWRLDLNGFLRMADELIVLLGNDRVFTYQNVYEARSVGVEAAAGWTSPGEYVALDGNVTYVDLRNTAAEGTFGAFRGDRIPNRPYLFANGAARLQLRNVAADDDELALVWNTRYVHEFFRGWESIGLLEFKQVVPSQLLHALALTYVVRGDPLTLGFTGEVQNVTDARAFDFFGVQRPGRAFYFKTTLEF